MTCDGCHDENATSLSFTADDPRHLCRRCYVAPAMRYNPGVRVGWEDGKGSISVGHLEDIKRRRVAPDGSVYRDFGRKTV